MYIYMCMSEKEYIRVNARSFRVSARGVQTCDKITIYQTVDFYIMSVEDSLSFFFFLFDNPRFRTIFFSSWEFDFALILAERLSANFSRIHSTDISHKEHGKGGNLEGRRGENRTNLR